VERRWQSLRKSYEAWNEARERVIHAFDLVFQDQLVESLSSLQKVNDDILNCTIGEDQVISRAVSQQSVLPNVATCRDGFCALHALAEAAVKASSRYSKEMLARNSLLHQLKDDVGKFLAAFMTDYLSIPEAAQPDENRSQSGLERIAQSIQQIGEGKDGMVRWNHCDENDSFH
jgi:hypothetical protein